MFTARTQARGNSCVTCLFFFITNFVIIYKTVNNVVYIRNTGVFQITPTKHWNLLNIYFFNFFFITVNLIYKINIYQFCLLIKIAFHFTTCHEYNSVRSTLVIRHFNIVKNFQFLYIVNATGHYVNCRKLDDVCRRLAKECKMYVGYFLV